MFLSIIIPIYNVERYIRSALESIYSQKYDEADFEVIVVNDGTTDNSMVIVDEYANKYDNLHIINQENQGLSCARNAGLRIAQGDYVWFVDSDDKISADSLTQLQHLIFHNSNIDIFAFNMVWVQEETGKGKEERIIPKKKHRYLYGQILCFNQIVGKFVTTPVQRYIFKRRFLLNNSLKFHPGIFHEDEEFVPRAMFMAKGICFVDYAPYCYLVRTTGNIMSDRSIKKTIDKIKIVESLNDFRKSHCRCYSERAFFDFYIFLLVVGIKADMIDKHITSGFQVSNKFRFRSLVINGLLSSAYCGLWKQVVKGFFIFLIPSLSGKVETFRRLFNKDLS